MTIYRILPRRSTAAAWTAANPILANGEMGYESDTHYTKRGDGVTAWNDLPYGGDTTAWSDVQGRPVITVTEYGAVGDGVTADTAAFAAALTAAGPGGAVFIPAGDYLITSTLTLPKGCSLIGAGMRSTRIVTTTDITAIRCINSHTETLKDFTIYSDATIVPRTTPNIWFTNPVKPLFESVKIDLGNSRAGGGITFDSDDELEGYEAAFMPVLSNCWIRNAQLVIDTVSDGKVSNCFIWAPGGTPGGTAAVDISNTSGWTFTNNDIVPPDDGTGAGYLLTDCIDLRIIGGYVDGSYDAKITRHGIKANNVDGLQLTGTGFWNIGQSALNFTDVHRSTVTGCNFSQNNKADDSYPDIDLYSSTCNTFTGNAHSAKVSRTNKGLIYREDASSGKNIVAANTLDDSATHYYDTTIADYQSSGSSPSRMLHNVPASRWPVGEMSIWRLRDTNGNLILHTSPVASAVNYLMLVNAATTANTQPHFEARGTSTDVNWAMKPQGSGGYGRLIDHNNADILTAGPGVASAVNFVNVVNAATGNAATITATGTDTDVDGNLTTKGSGKWKYEGTELATVTDTATASLATRRGHATPSGGSAYYGIPGLLPIGTTTGAISANTIYYWPMFVQETISMSDWVLEVTTGPASDANVRVGIYAADASLQPTGTPLYDSGNVAVATSYTGTKTGASMGLTLSPGRHLLAVTPSVNMTLRVITTAGSPISSTLGSSPLLARFSVSSTFGAFPSTPVAWTGVASSTVGMAVPVAFLWT